MTELSETGAGPADSMDELLRLRPDLLRCPYGAYAEQRAASPAVFSERLGGWLVTRHEDILEILRDTELFSNRMASGPSSVSGIAQRILTDDSYPERTRRQAARRIELSRSRVMLFADPPLHKRQRVLVSAGFTPRRVAGMDAVVEALVERLVDAFPAGPFDIAPAFSIPIPMTVIANLLGVPAAKMTTFKEWSDAFTRGVGALEHDMGAVVDIFDKVDAFYDYFSAELAARRDHPVEDLLSDLLAARLDGESPLSTAEILQMLVQFLVAGNETTTNLLTTAVWKLAQDPALQRRLRAEPAKVPDFVEEVLRLEAPVQGVWRVTVRDVAVGGVKIPADNLLYLITGSANHDPDVFERPDELDIDAARPRHLTFGWGEHLCIGMSLAKLEARIAVGVLLRRCSAVALAQPDAEPAFHRSFVLHGMGSLPVTVTRS